MGAVHHAVRTEPGPPTSHGTRRAASARVGDLVPDTGVFVPPGQTVAVVGARNGSPAAVVVDISSGKLSALDLGSFGVAN